MARFIGVMIIGIIVNCYFFTFSFTFLPQSVNTKIILATISVPLLIYQSLQTKKIILSQKLIGAIFIAIAFSVASFIACDYNNTSDYVYANYIFSFLVWLLAAYTACAAIRHLHKKVTIKLITFYLAGVCVFQCSIAIAMDQLPALQIFVDSYIAQGADFLKDVNRIYGIGASLDTAGTRFSITLIMIAGVLIADEEVRASKKQIYLLLAAFFTIAILGNIMSRTTSIGFIISLALLFAASGVHRLVIYGKNIKLYGILLLSITAAIGIFIYLYQSNSYFHTQLRYGFEGMFNWLETGVWRTDSTDKLNAVMWVWPQDTKTWIIGSGLFSNFVYSTDIGYCRFILYCGLIGFSIYAFFFIYNPYVFARQYTSYRYMFFAFFVLSFVIWFKVATDIFIIYAMLYCLSAKDEVVNNTQSIQVL